MIKYPIKLKDKIALICKAMKRPYYLMTRIAKSNYMFEIYDGTPTGNIINWTGISPGGAVDDALAYLTHEIEMGVVELPTEETTDEDIKKVSFNGTSSTSGPSSLIEPSSAITPPITEPDNKSVEVAPIPEKVITTRVGRRNKKK